MWHTHNMVCVSVCLSVCGLVTLMCCPETAALIKMPLEGLPRWPKKPCIRLGWDPTRGGNFGGCPVHGKALGVSTMVYTAKKITKSLVTLRQRGHSIINNSMQWKWSFDLRCSLSSTFFDHFCSRYWSVYPCHPISEGYVEQLLLIIASVTLLLLLPLFSNVGIVLSRSPFMSARRNVESYHPVLAILHSVNDSSCIINHITIIIITIMLIYTANE